MSAQSGGEGKEGGRDTQHVPLSHAEPKCGSSPGSIEERLMGYDADTEILLASSSRPLEFIGAFCRRHYAGDCDSFSGGPRGPMDCRNRACPFWDFRLGRMPQKRKAVRTPSRAIVCKASAISRTGMTETGTRSDWCRVWEESATAIKAKAQRITEAWAAKGSCAGGICPGAAPDEANVAERTAR